MAKTKKTKQIADELGVLIEAAKRYGATISEHEDGLIDETHVIAGLTNAIAFVYMNKCPNPESDKIAMEFVELIAAQILSIRSGFLNQVRESYDA